MSQKCSGNGQKVTVDAKCDILDHMGQQLRFWDLFWFNNPDYHASDCEISRKC